VGKRDALEVRYFTRNLCSQTVFNVFAASFRNFFSGVDFFFLLFSCENAIRREEKISRNFSHFIVPTPAIPSLSLCVR
jgi:hypothetical protein